MSDHGNRIMNDATNTIKNDTKLSDLITIADWKTAQITGGGLQRLSSLVEVERSANSTTHAWISLATSIQIQDQWSKLQALGSDATSLPLYGVPFAAKDNIDARGFPTTAGCPTFCSGPVATDAFVIARLKAAGAIIIGKTNMDQFATGLVGTRSPYGAVPNPFDSNRVSGGSSSGSAVVVARGAVPFSLGTDTAGSGRVPAGLNNIVGLKPTRGALSTRGVLPACKTLDCVSIFALTIADADTVLSVVEGYDEKDPYSRSRPDPNLATTLSGFGCAANRTKPSLAICADPDWFGRDDHYPSYEKALMKARSQGWNLVPVDFSLLFQLAQLLYSGSWIAERYEAIRGFIETAPKEEMDPVVRQIIIRARSLSAAGVFAGEYLRQDLTRQIQSAFDQFDGLLVPTSPTFPTKKQILQSPIEENSLLGIYTNFVNFLDWSALSIPAGFRPDGLPFGVTLISNQWQEPLLLAWARGWFGEEIRALGATSVEIREPCVTEASIALTYIPIAVVGAHLSGFLLNKDLVSRGAKLATTTKTSAAYRLFALETECGPKKPGLQRMTPGHEGAKIEVEVWNLPKGSLASFMATIPSPLAIGSIELVDGSWVQGFVCEPSGLANATDITTHGGWRAYNHHLQEKFLSMTNGIPKVAMRTVLVANRGEIAVRIIETVHKMGFRAVAIYSDTDADAEHVRKADIALHLQGSSVSETYLNIAQIIELAKSSSVDAVIPGYGFLAENAAFATVTEESGMIWVGPTPEQMSDLGLKHRARAIAIEAGVPVVPGCGSLLTSLEEALGEGERIGFPLMLKSTAGGGGIGLSYCKDSESLAATFDSVQRQATANFGNGGVFLERFVQRARHIEVQILGDGAGRVIAAGERDCSLQRRHQKIIEESPAAMVSVEMRDKMKAAAVRLASCVKYRNVGTVEFIYDVDTKEFYFLEVNTRLQVEHPITESVTGLDLVECMLDIAGGKNTQLFETNPEVSGASIEVRLYAESPLQNFRPCAGRITKLEFPSSLRVDTWVQVGTDITTSYDPLIAKLISSGVDRQEALNNLAGGLVATRIEGVQTNLEYLRQILASSMFVSGEYTTKSLDTFQFLAPSLEVVDPGILTTVQDYPGRTGYWDAGIPPSGPMDSYSFRLANRIVNNPASAAGIECTLRGPSLKFHCDALVAVTGGTVAVTVDGEPAPQNQAFGIQAGQVLSIGVVEHGHRVYLAVQGGIGVPVVMGSRATFELGKLGGFSGRKLQHGDILAIRPYLRDDTSFVRLVSPVPIPRQPKAHWTISVVPGPNGAPEYFTSESVKSLYSSEWRVHHNSNRLGVRLTGPRPEWARQTGGAAGLHPSNIHDAPYSIGSVSFTGDEAVVLGCDGPSLGGFVVFCVVASADMWKMGQVRPGDMIRFDPISVEAALELEKDLDSAIETLSPLSTSGEKSIDDEYLTKQLASIPLTAGHINQNGQKILVRQAGDRAFMLVFGEAVSFDLRQSFGIFAFCEQHDRKPISGVEELTPGVFSLHVTYAPGLFPNTMMARLLEHVGSYSVPTRVLSREVRLPMAFNDSVSLAAVERYAATIRGEAPWLPSNSEFLEQLNGIGDIKKLLRDAEFLVLGLGDVFMGSPCAIPLDPRHRLFGTKYNPSRSFTPRGAVGIGGQYLCIYATDSPGGYQLVGRTVDIWDSDLVDTGDDSEPEQDRSDKRRRSKPWFFQQFDRISFYFVDESELDGDAQDKLIRVSDGVLDLSEYEAWLEENKDDMAATIARQAEAIESSPFIDELVRPYASKATANSHVQGHLGASSVGGERVKAMMPGRCYKVTVEEGDAIKKGDVVLCIESSKMEVEIRSPVDGSCTAVLVKVGDLVDVNDDLVIIEG
ncbi:hypothetical protein FZEAL_6610 [Fusarium zealandicum]|uniref:Urea amidolyase n=1 Tax=Fusarium zealandicum TaxID=1053134 RepID=A0A8H4XIQ5_9HYPO|nr:hypothetical protein FZEAL_6610 [Fusarium zealandicum]